MGSPTTTIDVDRLGDALVEAFREEARSNWPWLRGDGWPAYSEHRNPEQVLNVTLIAKRVADTYARLLEPNIEDTQLDLVDGTAYRVKP